MNETNITKDAGKKQLTITRRFDAPVQQVWKAWTESALLDQWWAPRPWKANTKTMDFRNGGQWLYAMTGPDGSSQWCRADYSNVDEPNTFSAASAFCDEHGVINENFPKMYWKNDFTEQGDSTLVTVVVSFDSEDDLNKIVEMGFKEGFTAAHGNLDELLATKVVA